MYLLAQKLAMKVQKAYSQICEIIKFTWKTAIKATSRVDTNWVENLKSEKIRFC